MRALVVYESMYGNTHQIAEAIARGLRSAYAVQVVSVASAPDEHVGRYDLVVVGGPTHARGMSRPDTRQSAISAPGVQADDLQVEPGARRDDRAVAIGSTVVSCDGPAVTVCSHRSGAGRSSCVAVRWWREPSPSSGRTRPG